MPLKIVRLTAALLFSLIFHPHIAFSSNADCLFCHAEEKPVKSADGEARSIFVDPNLFGKSIHGEKECTDCHTDARSANEVSLEVMLDRSRPDHPARLTQVKCGACHNRARFSYYAGVHGKAVKKGNEDAPDCKECHGKHDILAASDPASPVYRASGASLCGRCHDKEGPAKGSDEPHVSRKTLIHGESFYDKGLVAAATCVDCHGGHMILPHTDKRSNLARANIRKTCERCHTKIERIHDGIIKNEMWRQKSDLIPSCQTCHPPHSVEEQVVKSGPKENRRCLMCHRKSVDAKILSDSAHRSISCNGCHTDIDPKKKHLKEDIRPVECANCHARFGEEYQASAHGVAMVAGNIAAPGCPDCHGGHNIRFHQDENAKTFHTNIPRLCGECHKPGRGVASAFINYSKSEHGRAALEEGSPLAAVCTDCHASHKILKADDIDSPVNRSSVAVTCGRCHLGIYKKQIRGVHGVITEDGKDRPTCSDCHESHVIGPRGDTGFFKKVTLQCGACHEKLAESYGDTIHGKAHLLGYEKSATCADCHGAHLVLPADDPESTIGVNRVVETCGKCHENANLSFASYLTHATHDNREQYPILFYTYWFMTGLLISVFGFFGLHTLLWLPRAVIHRFRVTPKPWPNDTGKYVRRFNRNERITHLFVIISFLLLALTGMTLKFATEPWAEVLNAALGGVLVASYIHRVAAVVTFGYFLTHFYSLISLKRERGVTWAEFIFDKNSLMFNRNDASEFVGTVKWFLGLGSRPSYGRWTYWEKFDYFAVFWGVPVIGLSGLVLWFPEFFTRWLPGWIINVAMIIHSDEALLAVGFIFTIHFFNTHLRPESFPMDTVIFTGLTPLAKYREERPREISELSEDGELEKRVTEKGWSGRAILYVKLVGALFLLAGALLIVMIIGSMLFA